ncbi:MAG: MBL fold metallo-hydrolase [archaeon]|jgi:hydroxyacylglutathione hydrolase
MGRVIQLQVGGFDKNFSYLVIGKTNESILIDPTGDAGIIENAIKENKTKVKLILFTHSHPDHCELAEHFSSQGIEIFFPKNEDLGKITSFDLNGMKIECIATPGHTKDSVVYIIGKNIFTGDTLFVRGVGTTAYGGDDFLLEKTLAFLFELDPTLALWPGHNYGGISSTLKEALNNSHIRPSKKTHELIKKMVEEYNLKHSTKKKF